MSAEQHARAAAPSAYPTQAAAAAMLGVAESTLSRAIRRHGIVVRRAGDRDRHVTAGDVLLLNDVFRRKIAEELAGELVDYAEAHQPTAADAILDEVTGFIDIPAGPPLDGDEFLEELRRALPAHWYQEAERVYRSTVTGPVAVVAVSGDGDADDLEGEEPSAPRSAAG